MGTKSLDKITAVLEQAVKSLRAGGPIRRKRMQLDEFVDYAAGQLAKAGQDEPDVAKRRLAALKRSVDDVITQVAKMAAEDTESTSVKVEVSTAFAPTGDTAIADLTTAADQSSTETSLAATPSASGGGSFAKSLAQVGKALKKMKAELEHTPSGTTRAAARKADSDLADELEGGRDPSEAMPAEEWPLDLNTGTFLEGTAADATALTWGADPEGLVSPKSR